MAAVELAAIYDMIFLDLGNMDAAELASVCLLGRSRQPWGIRAKFRSGGLEKVLKLSFINYRHKPTQALWFAYLTFLATSFMAAACKSAVIMFVRLGDVDVGKREGSVERQEQPLHST